jgi:hypothetical protein
MVRREFEEIFPGEVESVHVVYITLALDAMVKEFQSVQQKLEDLLDLYVTQRRRGRDISKRRTVCFSLSPPETLANTVRCASPSLLLRH